MAPDISSKIYAVLLAGGTGTRLWPVSRERYPKQLVKFMDEFSLLQATVKRMLPLIDAEKIRIVCGTSHLQEIARHMRELSLDPGHMMIAEPCGRNTAPAILLAVLQILREVPDAIIAVFPADHMIGDIAEFHAKIKTAGRLAEKGYIVTFGIQPDYPETGYGYIEGAEHITDGAMIIKRFVEKPDENLARQYVDAGNFFWNSGMFTFSASVMKAEFSRHCPEILKTMESLDQSDPDAMETGYRALPNISIDYAIMEKTQKGVVLPSAFGWSDIGSWKSLYDFLPKDDNGNVLIGDVISKNTRACLIMGQHRLIATNSLQDTVVIETPDAIFISNMENSREVKSIVNQLKQTDRTEHNNHRINHYPWGTVTLLEEDENHQISTWQIYPDAVLKLDIAPGKMRHLSIINGTAIVESEGRTERLKPGDATVISPNQEVFIQNKTQAPFQFVQVAIWANHTDKR